MQLLSGAAGFVGLYALSFVFREFEHAQLGWGSLGTVQLSVSVSDLFCFYENGKCLCRTSAL